jgi:hypothetical protein
MIISGGSLMNDRKVVRHFIRLAFSDNAFKYVHLILREEHSMRVSENRVLWRIFERESEEAILGW